MRIAFAKPVHAARARIDPHGPEHGTFTAKPTSHHVHVILRVTPLTSHCPVQKLRASMLRLCIFFFLRSAQDDATKSALQGLNGFNSGSFKSALRAASVCMLYLTYVVCTYHENFAVKIFSCLRPTAKI